MIENWKPVPGFEGRYEVSDRGRVKSLARPIPQKNGRTRLCGEVILKTEVNNGGYHRVQLWSGNHRHRKYVHRLVLEAFVGPCPDGMEACHWNDDPSDNRLENLRWASQSENTYDRVRNRIHPMAMKTHCVHGHEFTESNTIRAKHRKMRNCRACSKARQYVRSHPSEKDSVRQIADRFYAEIVGGGEA